MVFHRHSTIVYTTQVTSRCYIKYEIVLIYDGCISFLKSVRFYRIADDIFIGRCAWIKYPEIRF